MSERGRLGGRPREITLEQVHIQAAVGPGSGDTCEPLEVGT